MRRYIVRLGGTNEDSQGDSFPKEFFDRMAAQWAQGRPLHVEHDLSQPPIGRLSNYRVERDDDVDAWFLVADLELEDRLTDEEAEEWHRRISEGGFSWSGTEGMCSNSERAPLGVFVPHPLYRDDDVVQSLLVDGTPMVAGKHIQKGSDPASLVLLVGGTGVLHLISGPQLLVAAGVTLGLLNLLASPEEKAAFREFLETHLSAVWDRAQQVGLAAGIPLSADYQQTFETAHGHVDIRFVPERGAEVFSFDSIEPAMDEAATLCAAESTAANPVVRVTCIFEPATGRYRVMTLQFQDGRSLHL